MIVLQQQRPMRCERTDSPSLVSQAGGCHSTVEFRVSQTGCICRDELPGCCCSHRCVARVTLGGSVVKAIRLGFNVQTLTLRLRC